MAADTPSAAPLRLRAEDAEDLAVISACLQDALVAIRDLAYDAGERTFMLVANRFRWENGAAFPERVLCGIAFSAIEAVSYRGFRRAEEDRILCLLAVRFDSAATAEPGRNAIRLEFSDGAEIRLASVGLRCHARDLGEPWPTAWQPDHVIDEPASG